MCLTVRPNKLVCSRERFIAKPFKETGSLCLKSPELPKGFRKALLKNQMGGGWSAISLSQFPDWLMVRVVSQGLKKIGP